MGRPERPIDPDGGPVAEFARELRLLRDSAGRPSYRELARTAGFSVTVLSEAAGGQRLPTLPVVKGYVGACGGDLADWEQRWKRAAEQQREWSTDSAGPAPYLGLASYGVEHADLYFGREELTGELVERLRRGRFLAVFGPSGSGKSSLLRAGLLAAMQRGDAESATGWETVLLTPGEQPLAALTRALDAMTADAEIVLVVDQFEELFTVCRDTVQRDRFVHALLAAASDDARVRVVLGIRADFYAQCATWPGLVTALRDAQVLVGSMDHGQLRDVIVKPAQQAGVAVESALVATVIAETGAEPGALALVSHALLETWRHSPPGRLTLAAYQQAGGVAHAIASTAERVYASCGDDEQRLLRQILLRLVALGDGGPDTRRRVPRGELAGGSDPGAADGLVERLVQARLVTLDEGAVLLAHEALIRSWPRLAEWLADGRESLQVQRRIADAASEWVRYGRDTASLYRGAPLALARAWAERDGHLTGLTPVEREFLGASSAAATRATRRYRVLVAALVVLLAAVGGAGWTAAWQRESALSSASAAASGQLAVLSAALASAGDPDAAVLAALGAWSAEPTPAARSALLSTIGCCGSPQASVGGSYVGTQAVALSPDGKLLAAGGKGVHVWDTADGRQIAVLRGSAAKVHVLAFSASGLIAAGYADHRILLWNLAGRRVVRVLAGDTGTIEDLAFSPSGRLLAAASNDGQIRLWNPDTGQAEQLLPRPGKPMLSVAFSPDGKMLAAAGKDGAVTLWDLSNAVHPRAAHALAGAAEAITTLAFSPHGTLLAGQERDGDVLLWNLDRDRRFLIPHAATKDSRGLGFSRDDSILLTLTYHELRLWDTRTGRLAAIDLRRIPGEDHALAYDPRTGTLAMAGGAGLIELWQAPIQPFTASKAPVTGLAVVPGEPVVISASADDTLRLWHGDGSLSATASLTAHPDAVAVSPDGKLLATAVADGAITVRTFPGLAQHLRMHTLDHSMIASLAFSPDSRLLAASAGHAVTVWDTASGAPGRSFRVSRGNVDIIAFGPGDDTLTAVTSKGDVIIWDTRTDRGIARASVSSAPLDTVAFSRTGRLLATGGDDGNITVWDPRNLRRLLVFPGPGGPVHALAFSPDGHALAAAGATDTITLRDTRNWSEIADLTSSDHSMVRALAFGPAGATLMSGDESGRIIAWSLDPRAVIRADCQMLARDPGLGQAAAMVPRASYPRLCSPGGS